MFLKKSINICIINTQKLKFIIFNVCTVKTINQVMMQEKYLHLINYMR